MALPEPALETEIEAQKREFTSICLEVATLTKSIRGLETSTPRPVPVAPAPKSQTQVEIPLTEPESLDGIISYLTKKHGGNVHEQGIVTITSKSLRTFNIEIVAIKNVADLTAESRFVSGDEPGQWICWDFHEMRVIPVCYTIEAYTLQDWELQGSVDGKRWTVIGGATGIGNFELCSDVTSFPCFQRGESRYTRLPQTGQFRFIRLVQTDRNSEYGHCLKLHAVEFFGTLFE
jgi:hypothetical protein